MTPACLNLARLDWTRPGDLKTQDEYQVTRLDWTRPGDLKTQDKYQVTDDLCSSDGSCLNLTRLDRTRSGDLKTQDEYQRRLDQAWTWTFEDPRRISDVDRETGLQQEEEPDFCRQGCVKEDGEE
ncbi:hypothetical protein Bbelb_016110 [Branchiostoma belcheri]|nr:hypothetical protein Bbelb_016110 [Branchiostoma belcheri]